MKGVQGCSSHTYHPNFEEEVWCARPLGHPGHHTNQLASAPGQKRWPNDNSEYLMGPAWVQGVKAHGYTKQDLADIRSGRKEPK